MPIIVVVVVILAAVGFLVLSQDSSPSTVPSSAPANGEEAMMMEGDSTSVVLSEQNDSGEYGTATLTEQDGELVVAIEMTGFAPGVVQPAHIHTGTCADIGGVVHALEFPVDGMSETTLATTLAELATAQPLAINVHKSVPEASVYTACGDLEL